MKPIRQFDLDAGKLIRAHPPRWRETKKALVYRIACSSRKPFEGQISYRQWAEEIPPKQVASRSRFTIHPGTYDYGPSAEPRMVPWHVNFADRHLFGAYSSSLMAQDEHQVAEHPILGSIREALLAESHSPQTVSLGGKPTPITISGVQRRCVINSQPDPAAGRARGLYGNEFGRATTKQVVEATKALDPPTVSNILAIAAPTGYGVYTREDINYILNTAYTGFLAAREESQRLIGEIARPVVHTGFWGCGAFGGNRKLMSILQALAGDLAGVEIEFWAFNQASIQCAREAVQFYEDLLENTSCTETVLNSLSQKGFRWGIPDGN